MEEQELKENIGETKEAAEVTAEKSTESADKATEEVKQEPVTEDKETTVAGETSENEEDDNSENEEDELSEEEKRAAKSKKIKIGIVVAGGVFILLAAVYAAAVAGGRTNKIPVAMPEDEFITETEPAKEVEKKPVVAVTEPEEEEETAPDSLVSIVQGNRRYDECIYADGGVVIVRKDKLFGAIDYEGNEIAPVKYAEIIESPTSKGYFVLGNTVTEDVTEEKDGATLSYSKETTTYTLYDNKGTKVFEGNCPIFASDEVYALGVEDDKDSRKNRIEYYRFDGKNKAFQVIYVNDPSYLTGFRDGKTVVYGFSAVPTEDQDTNPTNLVGGLMDEKGKVSWFATAPGIKEFSKEVEEWKADNKEIKTTNAKEKKVKEKEYRKRTKILIKYNDDGTQVWVDRNTLTEEEVEKYLALYEMEDEEEVPDGEEEDADGDGENDQDDKDDETDDEKLTDEELEEIEDEVDLSSGPKFIMDGILNAPVDGYFVTRDIYDVTDPYSFYDTKGNWLTDIDTSYLKADAKKGFVVGNFNNGSVEVKKFISNGEVYWHYGTDMVLTIGNKDVLIDAAKVAGLTDTVNDRMIVAVYDEISISDSQYWLFKNGNKCGYMDHKGKDLKYVFEDATDFVDGHALVVKDGKAYLIDEEFNNLEDLGEANNVIMSGDIMMVIKDGVVKNYILKDRRTNPQGKTEEKTSDSEAVAPATDKKKNK